MHENMNEIFLINFRFYRLLWRMNNLKFKYKLCFDLSIKLAEKKKTDISSLVTNYNPQHFLYIYFFMYSNARNIKNEFENTKFVKLRKGCSYTMLSTFSYFCTPLKSPFAKWRHFCSVYLKWFNWISAFQNKKSNLKRKQCFFFY